jgi:hypothetical protein
MAGYNYEHFDAYIESPAEAEEFGGFRQRLHVRERAPDGALLTLDGPRIRLSEAWETRGIVLEFGSFT